MSGVLQKIIERTWVFLLVVGLAVLLIGASGGIQSQSVSIVIPEIGWRVLVSLVGIILFFVGLLQVLPHGSLIFSGSFSNLHPPYVWVFRPPTTIYGKVSELPQRPSWGANCQVARNGAK